LSGAAFSRGGLEGGMTLSQAAAKEFKYFPNIFLDKERGIA
jgi:hypothetical protein